MKKKLTMRESIDCTIAMLSDIIAGGTGSV
jgi:hypothetical protein